jgi:hypothetical protein
MFSVFPDFELCLSSSRPKSILDGSLGVPGTYSIEYIYNDITYIYIIFIIYIYYHFIKAPIYFISFHRNVHPRGLWRDAKTTFPCDRWSKKGPTRFGEGQRFGALMGQLDGIIMGNSAKSEFGDWEFF